jgi:hypothetical protein
MAKVVIPNFVQAGANIGGRYGPFKDDSGNLWIIGYLTGTFKLTAWRSTDGGATWNTNFQATGAGSATLDCFFDITNQIIYAVADSGGTRILGVWKFQISTTTWSEVFSSGTRPQASNDTTYTKCNASILVRSTGEIVVVYQGPTHSVMGTAYDSVYYARLSSAGVWSAGVQVDDNAAQSYPFLNACLGASDRVHMFMNANGTAKHRSLDSTNVMDTLANVTGVYGVANNLASFWNSTRGLMVVFQGGSVVSRASSVANPTWTDDPVTLAAKNTVAAALVYDGAGKIIIVYVDNSTSDIFTSSSSTTSWPAGTLLDVATGPGWVSAGYMAVGQAGVTWNDGSQYFDAMTTAGPKPLPVAGISATSTVSGAGFRELPRVTSGAVAAASTVSGGVRVTRKVAPAAITATSTVSGAVGRIKKLTTAAVAATSTVGGSVRRTAAITPAAIAVTSTISGSVGRIAAPKQLPVAVISATSTVSGLVGARRRVKPTTNILATSTVSGAVAGKRPITPIGVFPSTPVLDNFNQVAGTAPPSSIWSLWLWGSGGDMTAVGDGTARADEVGGNVSGDYYNVAQSLDSEIYVGLSTAASQYTFLGLRGSAVDYGTNGSRAPGYVLQYQPQSGGGGTCQLWRNNAQIASFSGPPCGNGGAIGFRATGTNPVRIEIWAKADGVSPWVLAQVYNDFSASRITTPGYVGATLGPTQRADYAGGGAVVPAFYAPVQAISTISGAVARKPGIVPTSVLATSAVSGAVAKVSPKPIPAAAISALCTVGLSSIQGSFVVIRRVPTTVIAATSTISGAIGRLRPVTPAQISATSTVSGAVRVTRKIAGALVATSTVSGSVVARRAVSGAISATSTVSGAIKRLRGIFPAAVTATSTVSGVVSKAGGPKPIPGGVISATSTVSGSVIKGPVKTISGAVSATSTVGGNVTAVHAVRGVISATSIVSGSVTARRAVTPAQISATSTVSGSVRVTRAIRPVSIAATSIVSGVVQKGIVRAIIPAGITATSTVSGSTRVLKQIPPAQIVATSTVSGRATAIHKVAGAISATSTVSGAVARIPAGKYITPTTNINATSTITGGFRRLARVGGAVSATSTVSGALGALRRVLGAISALSTVSGSLTALRRLAPAAITATSVISGSLVFIRRIPVAAISATSTISGLIGRRRPVGGAISATSTITGAIRRLRPVVPVGGISATSTISGKVVVIRHPAGAIFATSVINGRVVVKRRITGGAVLAISVVSGDIIRKGAVPFHGNIFATSTLTGSVRLNIIIYGKTTPRLTSATSEIPQLVSGTSTGSQIVTAGNGKTTLISGSSEIPRLTRGR